ncbi:protein immune deficiency-like [Mercenaria mercenaria]|uniref:protein immune deficiency-like n=1 Tax=Mercenaria mercenaria TaxID=6596 RepID=UPI00234FA436|nr:protein immune deficiency-like [Mercenaria mercenaria]
MTIMSEEGEKRKSKKKSKSRRNDYDDDYVEREVAKAMKQMEKAMKQAKIAEKEARQAHKEGSSTRRNINVAGDSTDEGKTGMTIIHNTVTHPGTYIHVESAENIQVGSHNTMHIYKDKKKGRKSSKRDSSSDSDDGAALVRQATVPVQEKDPSEMTEAERRIFIVLESKREVAHDDMTVCSEHVGNWRRFLRHLGLEESLLEQLHQDYYVEGVRQIIYQGVLEWTRKEGRKATVGVLARTLQKVDYTDAIFHLQP